jgi:hypothetical protein
MNTIMNTIMSIITIINTMAMTIHAIVTPIMCMTSIADTTMPPLLQQARACEEQSLP